MARGEKWSRKKILPMLEKIVAKRKRLVFKVRQILNHDLNRKVFPGI